MHQYWYVNSKGSGKLYHNQISVPFYSQPPLPNLGGIYGPLIPEGWSGQVYHARWKRPGVLKGFEHMEQADNWTSSARRVSLNVEEPSSSWTTPADNKSFTSLGNNGISVPLVDVDGWEVEIQPTNWPQPADHEGSTSQKQPGNWVPLVNHDDWESHEQSDDWPQIPKHAGVMSQEHKGNWLQQVNPNVWESQVQPANWPQIPKHPGFMSQGQSSPWAQPINHAGMFAQGNPLGWSPSASHAGFPKKLFPWAQPVNHAGMFAQGPLAALLPPSVNPFGFKASGQQAKWGGFGNPAGWGGHVNPLGWGNNNSNGNGQPGILGSLLKAGKGTMNGIGIISSLIGVGKFLF
ncbi:hypothetical protein J7E81_11775 [Bacillus sp. ISL-18]|uniref:hypothetical protein n=1 Tax=Bacillus sp. ISL-18 TaxID=2819118 RepID=UPI001BECC2D0|nr:hypothetical protein [Bacillus sp. ISL-18]